MIAAAALVGCGGGNGLVDTSGIPLDGDRDGQPGGIYASAFEIGRQRPCATLSDIQAEISTATCATAGCHAGANPPDGLYLVPKVKGTDIVAHRMPLGQAPLSNADDQTNTAFWVVTARLPSDNLFAITTRPGGRDMTMGRKASVVLFACFYGALVFAQVPNTLRYEGYLADASGQPLDNPVSVTFSIYTVESGGTPLWTDVQVVVPEQGLFSAELGNPANPFQTGLFDTPLYLGLAVEADAEMTPRVAFAGVPYAQKAVDAERLGGLPASALDQSTEVSLLSTETGLLQARLGVAESDIDDAELVISGLQGEVGLLQAEVSTNQLDVAQLQTDLVTTGTDLAVVEATLPSLQPLVSQSCVSGSSIRQITATGTVFCETDNAGPLAVLGGNAYLATGNLGVGTNSPNAAIEIDAPAGQEPFRARVGNSTALRVHTNRSVSVGTSGGGPFGGLFVNGDTGLGTPVPSARLSIDDDNWQLTLDNGLIGGNEWYVGSSADSWGAGGGKLVFSPTSGSSNAALVLDSERRVGIGTIAPDTRLHIEGGSDVAPGGGGFLTLGDGAGANVAIDSNEIMARNGGSAATLALNAEGGKVTINSNGSSDADALEVNGRVAFRVDGGERLEIDVSSGDLLIPQLMPSSFEFGRVGTGDRPFFQIYSEAFFAGSPLLYMSYSDRSLKRNVQPIPDALDIVNRLDGVTYELERHPFDDGKRVHSEKEQYDRAHQLGFVAQDVEKVLPQLVNEDPTSGLKTVGYMGLIPILVEAVKAQQLEIEAQRAEIEALKRDRVR